MEIYKDKDFISKGGLVASEKDYKGVVCPHRHEFFEIEYIISGGGTYLVNGREYPLEEGRLFFMSPADFHSVQ